MDELIDGAVLQSTMKTGASSSYKEWEDLMSFGTTRWHRQNQIFSGATWEQREKESWRFPWLTKCCNVSMWGMHSFGSFFVLWSRKFLRSRRSSVDCLPWERHNKRTSFRQRHWWHNAERPSCRICAASAEHFPVAYLAWPTGKIAGCVFHHTLHSLWFRHVHVLWDVEILTLRWLACTQAFSVTVASWFRKGIEGSLFGLGRWQDSCRLYLCKEDYNRQHIDTIATSSIKTTDQKSSSAAVAWRTTGISMGMIV